jgi:Phosphodiester glycosidase
MRGGVAARVALVLLALLLSSAGAGSRQSLDLGAPREIASGITLYHLADPSLLDPPAPVSVWLLRVNPGAADLRAVLSNDAIVDTEIVPDIATRQGAIAAINAGFFLIPSGDPSGIYKLRGQLVSDTKRPRGALGIVREASGPRLLFGRVAATMSLRLPRRARVDAVAEIAGVDTTRQRGRLMLFTPAYHQHTDTPATGLEWVVQGKPLRVTSGPLAAGKTPIPRDGYVLSFGGTRPPPPLQSLRIGTLVELDTKYTAVDGSEADWEKAEAIVGGAGLLLRDGRIITDWKVEQLAQTFAQTRHPRTLVGTHDDGSIWLVTVDGRQPRSSVGMSLFELRALVERLGLRNALNLDGGGSTTMWVAGKIVNSPSDAAGPRRVSDALIVTHR